MKDFHHQNLEDIFENSQIAKSSKYMFIVVKMLKTDVTV